MTKPLMSPECSELPVHTVPYYVAVGLPIGYLGPHTTPVPYNGITGWIRKGRELFAFSADSMKLWGQVKVPQTIDSLVRSFSSLQAFDQAWSDLVDLELVVALPDAEDNRADRFWHSYRAIPQGYGIGTNFEDNTLFTIMLGDDIAIRVCFLDYMVFAYCDGMRTIRDAALAASQHLQIDVALIIQRLPELIRALLTSGVIFLDAVGISQ